MTINTVDVPSEDANTPDAIPELAPIAAAERIDAMDILRGFALIGILLMNIEWFNRPIADLGGFDKTLTGLDHAFGWLIRCFVEGKFYKLFALIFGMGFAVMLIRARDAGKPFGAWFTRRMLALMVFGLLHMVFLWSGDILHDYAFGGLIFLGWIYLFQTRYLKKFDHPKAFLKIAMTWLFIPFVVSTIAAIGFGVALDQHKLTEQWQKGVQIEALFEARMELPVEDDEDAGSNEDAEPELDAALESESENESDEEEAEMTEEEMIEEAVTGWVENRRERLADREEEIVAFTQDSYWEATRYRLRQAAVMLKFTPMFTFTMLLPIFLLGYWFISSGVLRNHQDFSYIFKPMAVLGMSFGLFFTVGGLMVMQHPTSTASDILAATGGTLFFLGQYVLAAGYLGTIVVLLGSPTWARRLARLAPLGRMALTNYIMHSVILTTLFYGYAGAQFGQISRSPQMLIVVAIIVSQMIFSTWWLNRYRFGPLEWLWRSLTYKSMQAMKI
jgi:uncharacterized protein